jgi:type IV pilus biogenesis protein PilP
MITRYTMHRAAFGARALCAAALLTVGTTAALAAQGLSSDWDEGAPKASSAPAVSIAPAAASVVMVPAAPSVTPHHDVAPAVEAKANPATSVAQSSAPPQEGKGGDYQAPTWSSYYGSVDAIRADTQKAQAELDNLKIHHELDQARNGVFDQNGSGSTSPSTSPLTPMGMAGANAGSAAAQADRGPLVQQVSMVDGRWTAVIQLTTGAHMTVHQGETVRGLGKVESIALGQVEVSSGGKTSSLQFAGDNTAEAAPPTQGVRTMTPPVPFGMH